jgi:hypothetical protein
MASGTLLEAPADRPAGQRGWRGPAAFVVAVAAIPPLAMSRLADGWDIAAYLVAAVALAMAAVLIWTTRRAHAIVLAGVAVAASAIVVVLIGFPNRHDVTGGTRGAEYDYRYDPGASPITGAQAKAVPEGSTEDEVEEILGSAAGSGTLRRRDGADSHCLVYPNQAGREFYEVFAFCFAGDRYASLHRW